MYYKDFDSWNTVKKRIHEEKRNIYIRAGEIRWITLGVNVGSEMDGKGESFSRPVLVVHVIGSYLALVIPLSTKIKKSVGYISFDWKEQRMSLCIHQMRIISQKRILARKGRISTSRLEKIKEEIKKFYSF